MPRIIGELCSRGGRHYRNHVQTTDSNHNNPIALILLAEALTTKATDPLDDQAYIETAKDWLNLIGIWTYIAAGPWAGP